MPKSSFLSRASSHKSQLRAIHHMEKHKKNAPHHNYPYASSMVFFSKVSNQSAKERMIPDVFTRKLLPFSIVLPLLALQHSISLPQENNEAFQKGWFQKPLAMAINIQNACSYLKNLYSMYHNVKICKDHSRGSSRNAQEQWVTGTPIVCFISSWSFRGKLKWSWGEFSSKLASANLQSPQPQALLKLHGAVPLCPKNAQMTQLAWIYLVSRKLRDCQEKI